MTGYTSIHMVRDTIGSASHLISRSQSTRTTATCTSPRTTSRCGCWPTPSASSSRGALPPRGPHADHALEIAAGTIEAGTVAAMQFGFDGIVYGRPVISFEGVWRVSDEVAPEWPSGDSRWLLHIDGDPTVDSELMMATEEAGGTNGVAVGRDALPQCGADRRGRHAGPARQPHTPGARRGLPRPARSRELKGRTMTDDRTAVLETSLIIGDRRIDESKGGRMEHVNPATGRPNPKQLSVASVEEVDDAVTAAEKDSRCGALDARQAADALFRLADVLMENSALLGTISALETGEPYSGYGGVYSADWIRYYAGWADKITGESINAYPFPGIDFTKPEPYGVVAVFVASNGPAGFFGMAGAPALAAGCSIVIKPPELAPYTSIIFGRLALEAGFPPGVVNVVNGGGESANALVTHSGVDKVTFTGGTATGRRLQAACAETLKPLVLELGGKSANIIFADADIDAAIRRRPVHQQRRPGLLDAVPPPGGAVGLRPRGRRRARGDQAGRRRPSVRSRRHHGPGHQRGVGEPHRRHDRRGQGHRRGAGPLRRRTDGRRSRRGLLRRADHPRRRRQPVPIAQTEIFGPVLCVIPFDTEEEAIALANDTGYGLAAYAQTQHEPGSPSHRRPQRGHGADQQHRPGPVSPASPFGGIKQSGYGREGSRLGLDEFLMIKNVYLNI